MSGLQPTRPSPEPRIVDELIATLDEHARDRAGSRASGSWAIEDLRALIEAVTILPDLPRLGFKVEVRGRLSELIGGGRRRLGMWGTRGSEGGI